MHGQLEILFILTFGLTFACIFGYIAKRLKISPILGYLIAGYLIGPYSPGFVANLTIAEQLAEIGVVLMLFAVGLHFKVEDLIRVKNIAIPGAIVQTLAATVVTTIFITSIGWSLIAGLIMGLSIGVASTVVLVRVLTDNHLLDTLEGHIAVGWLIVEDIFTVIILILLPTFVAFSGNESVSGLATAGSILWVLVKFSILVTFMFTWGQKIVSYILTKIALLRSHEMFTLAVLSLVFLIATGSAVIFGTSVPLGAFIAGMVIGKTNVKNRAAANALPFKDIFAIVFFLAVGMLFNPIAIVTNFPLFLGILGVIIIVKPLSAYLISTAMGYPIHVALTVAISLAQIGEFSFILAEEAMKLSLLPDEGYDIIVACAIISIVLNPWFFQMQDFGESWIHKLKYSKNFKIKSVKRS